MSSIQILDANGVEIVLGGKYKAGDEAGEVVSISDPDGDVDDETGRGIQIPPYVTVRYEDGSTEEHRTYSANALTWADYPDGPAVWLFQTDDLVQA